MSVSLPHYARIKDNYCVAYFGNSKEYLIQLKVLRPIMESMLPGIKVYISCKGDSIYLLKGEDRVISREELQKTEFAYIRELTCDMLSHPIEEFMLESNLPCGPITTEHKLDGKCVLLTNGVLPTQTLTGNQIQAAINHCKQKGFEPELNKPINDAGWVIGVENEDLFQAGIDGKKVTLIPTGLGENLFKAMFPYADILRLPA